jgi:hypothetical protein
VIVDDRNIVRVSIAPDKAKTPLVVYSYAVLSLSFSMQRLQTIPRWCCEITQLCRAIQLPKLSARDLPDGLKASAAISMVKPLGLGTPERPDHYFILYSVASNVKR